MPLQCNKFSLARIFLILIPICFLVIVISWNLQISYFDASQPIFIQYDRFEVFPNHFLGRYKGNIFRGKNFSQQNVEFAIKLVDFMLKNTKDGSPMNDLEVLKADPMFVTGFSDNHAGEMHNQLRQMQKIYPGKKVIVYNLGLK